MTRDEAIDALIELLAEQIVDEHFAAAPGAAADPTLTNKDPATHDERA